MYIYNLHSMCSTFLVIQFPAYPCVYFFFLLVCSQTYGVHSVHLSGCTSMKNLRTTRYIFLKLDVREFYKELSSHFSFPLDQAITFLRQFNISHTIHMFLNFNIQQSPWSFSHIHNMNYPCLSIIHASFPFH
jgi:hypothetical protein